MGGLKGWRIGMSSRWDRDDSLGKKRKRKKKNRKSSEIRNSTSKCISRHSVVWFWRYIFTETKSRSAQKHRNINSKEEEGRRKSIFHLQRSYFFIAAILRPIKLVPTRFRSSWSRGACLSIHLTISQVLSSPPPDIFRRKPVRKCTIRDEE